MCKVSIVIPYFNNENTILRALNSVIGQTYKNYEIILINDGSTDKSQKIVEDFIKKNDHVKIRNFRQTNSGPSSARNKGIHESIGKYIAFLDADDEWTIDKLEKQILVAESCDIDLLSCNYNIFKMHKSNKLYFTRENLKKVGFKKVLFKHYFATSCVLVKKDVILQAGGFPEEQKYMEDALVFTRIVRNHDSYITNDFLVNTYKNSYGESGLSKNLYDMERYELLNFKKLKEENKYNNIKISFPLYLAAVFFSILKYIKRIFILKYRSYSIFSNKGK